ncbi:hypothetical protein GVY41_02530 [Frigidibacter albus]|uniref:DUF4136 domain-containing protein n=1 Tax=Frigidibacter albus TaxID=1465486 RepID=A0A6L8VCL7_9RHOB|nr:hypothetical protein [Frigidibacter albus]MZQ87974.1 hypothetical protein [Frigidibacter albus]NBE29880.1 hypothetical protein [Frigidibacter albus]GGH42215.1 hypothetical protein GCM10011341_00010 [Frigidibacter albus]
MTSLPRRLLAIAAIVLVSACAREDLSAPPEALGNFQLGHTIIVAKNAQVAGPSRTVTDEEWQAALQGEILKRTGRYEGDKLYHLGINIDAYALAYPGIPLVISPKSILVVSANVWDDSAQRRINAEPKQITVFEPFSGETLLGSGLMQDKQAQMTNLSEAAARQINDWLVENKAWFTPEAAAARALLPAAAGGAAASVPPPGQVPAAARTATAAPAPAGAPAAPPAPVVVARPAAAAPPAPAVQARPAPVPCTAGQPCQGIDTGVRNSATSVPGLTLP